MEINDLNLQVGEWHVYVGKDYLVVNKAVDEWFFFSNGTMKKTKPG